MSSEESMLDYIDNLIKTKEVLLFMKGNPTSVKCGFSSRVVEILDSMGIDYAHVDVIADPVVREAVKTYSDWPTIPQLYVQGKFIGGCDIISQMHESGELRNLLLESTNSTPTV